MSVNQITCVCASCQEAARMCLEQNTPLYDVVEEEDEEDEEDKEDAE